MATRATKEKASGKKLKGKEPAAPKVGPWDKDQINLTDEASRIMPVSGGGLEQAYNSQAGVDATAMLVIATSVTQATNEKQQVEPMLVTLTSQTATQGKVDYLTADTGYSSAHNMSACNAALVEPLIAVARENHHPPWRERHTAPAPLSDMATPAETMAHRVKTKDGRKRYALRKQTVEPVFGIIKSVMGFRQFSLRSLDKVRGEWRLVCLAWNLKRLAVLRPKFG